MLGVVVVKEELFWFYSEFALGGVGIGEGLGIADGLMEMPGIFSEIDFPVHAICDLLVVDLLLDVQFGQFA